MALPKEQLQALLNERCRISTSYPWYGGWEYDNVEDKDPFLNALAKGVTPAMLEMLEITGSKIYPCSRISATHKAEYGLFALMADVDTTMGICEPDQGEIFVAREYKLDSGVYTLNQHPTFVAAHELAHIIDERLGDYEPDPHGEGPHRPASKLDPYIQEAFEADKALADDDQTLRSAYRRGLLAGDNKKVGRNDATEIFCDLVAHHLTGDGEKAFQKLKAAHPNVMKVALLYLEIVKAERYTYTKHLRRGRMITGVESEGIEYDPGAKPEKIWATLDEYAKVGLMPVFNRASSDIGSPNYIRAADILVIADRVGFNGVNKVPEAHSKNSYGAMTSFVQFAGYNALVGALKQATNFSRALKSGKLVEVNDAFTTDEVKGPAKLRNANLITTLTPSG